MSYYLKHKIQMSMSPEFIVSKLNQFDVENSGMTETYRILDGIIVIKLEFHDANYNKGHPYVYCYQQN